MASLELQPKSGHYHIRFRYAGREYRRSLKTDDHGEACGVLARLKETQRLVERGRIELPESADPAAFFLSDGRIIHKPEAQRRISLQQLFADYQQVMPTGVKEESTLRTEQIHLNHLLRLLPANKAAVEYVPSDLQKYVNTCLKESHRGKVTQPDTVKKELATFRVVWNWAVDVELMEKRCPAKGILFPRRKKKLPFMIWSEITRALAAGQLYQQEQSELWDALYLKRSEVGCTFGKLNYIMRLSASWMIFCGSDQVVVIVDNSWRRICLRRALRRLA